MHITAGKFNSRKLISPKGENVRPTLSKTRSAVFDTLFSIIDFENKTFLDLFAGSGIMGLEAISRGFSSCLAIEKDRKTALNIKANYELLGLKPNVIQGDSIKKLEILTQKFDVIYIDPPYFANLYNISLKLILEKNILAQNGIIILEYPQSINPNIEGYEIIKQKTYGDKNILFLQQNI